MTRTGISLCGEWKYSVNGGSEEVKTVPFSTLCVGNSVCVKAFSPGAEVIKNKRSLLVFEGITYKADVVLNGEKLGTMVPYSRYVFDVSETIRSGDNTLVVTITDMGIPFGPSEGWENYGGIIREVYLEFVSPAYIGDFFWKTKFNKTYSEADCSVEFEIEGLEKGGAYSVGAVLLNRSNKVVEAKTPVNGPKPELKFKVLIPALWSPLSPYLYDIAVSLYKDGVEIDRLEEKVGFKEFKALGNRFHLNGEPIFLKGVCRHDMWGHSGGHTLTCAQMEQDMNMIKDMGCNFVRLVHYPHNRKIVEIADRLGLLVSEEPGLWWSDLKRPETYRPGLEVLARTIRRDRNRVSAAFWLSFNECELTPEFVSMAAKAAHDNDPTRPVSGANCMNTKATKKLFTEQGFDFYTYHPYGLNPDHVGTGIGGSGGYMTMAQVMEDLDDKPLVFTEWGGYWPIGNRKLFSDFFDTLIAASKSSEQGKILAGMSYWQWNDIYETNRGLPACMDGILIEGLVDVDRNPKPDFEIFHRKLMEFDYDSRKKALVEISGIKNFAQYLPIDIGAAGANSDKFKAALIKYEGTPEYHHKVKRRLSHGPVLEEDLYSLGEMPVIIRKGPPLTISASDSPVVIPVNADVKSLFFVGHVGMGKLYPFGDLAPREIAEYTVAYESGEKVNFPIRNGIEICSAFGTYGPSRIDPRASKAPRALKITYDVNWEVFYVNVFEAVLPHAGKVKNVTVKGLDEEASPLLYGITAVLNK
jgi:beta-glucuronidase